MNEYKHVSDPYDFQL